ncbi:MAG TPA: hypothetical protein VGK73_22535 [Polyangiaceae bacterium]
MRPSRAVAASLFALGLAGAVVWLSWREEPPLAPRSAATGGAIEAPVLRPSRESRPKDEVLAAATRASDGTEPDALARPAALVAPPPAQWPPQRAFTARCRAPGGGCAAQCTKLAGDRCLDPCFIHTDACSSDCRQPDGSCGWPPPDNE